MVMFTDAAVAHRPSCRFRTHRVAEPATDLEGRDALPSPPGPAPLSLPASLAATALGGNPAELRTRREQITSMQIRIRRS